MNSSLYIISITDVFVCLIPVILVVIIYFRWALSRTAIIYATTRMLSQLFLIGFALSYIFQANNGLLIVLVLLVMLTAASWIALNPIPKQRPKQLKAALLTLGLVCFSTLAYNIIFVIKPDPWYKAEYLIPLAGMIFANAMNSLSLAAERYSYELANKIPANEAKIAAFQASLIPIINTYLAVGLVSLPGMMTGQILAGIKPWIAVRYQILIMSSALTAGGLSSFIFLTLVSRKAQSNENQST